MRAKRLLAARGIRDIDEIDVSEDRWPMMQRSGGRMTVPQIFIDGAHVGGFDDLAQWQRDGRLDRALEASAEL